MPDLACEVGRRGKDAAGEQVARERALVSRGDVTLWLSPEARATWIGPPSGRPGGQQRFSNLAIETALTLRLVFRLPLRQTEGFVQSILTAMRTSLDAPDHATLSRRSQLLEVLLRKLPATGPLHLIVDSTGLSVVGEGEWAAAKHGGRGTRGWKKLHLGVDRSGMIVAHSLTEATVDDASMGTDLIGAAVGPVASVTGDAAYDTIAFYEAASARDAQVVVPPIMTAKVSRHGPRSSVRDRTIADVEALGRREWKKASGYHQQARVENAFFRYKCLIGAGRSSAEPQRPQGRGEPCAPHPEPDDRAWQARVARDQSLRRRRLSGPCMWLNDVWMGGMLALVNSPVLAGESSCQSALFVRTAAAGSPHVDRMATTALSEGGGVPL